MGVIFVTHTIQRLSPNILLSSSLVVVVVYLNDSLEAIGAYQEGFVLQKIIIYMYILKKK